MAVPVQLPCVRGWDTDTERLREECRAVPMLPGQDVLHAPGTPVQLQHLVQLQQQEGPGHQQEKRERARGLHRGNIPISSGPFTSSMMAWRGRKCGPLLYVQTVQWSTGAMGT